MMDSRFTDYFKLQRKALNRIGQIPFSERAIARFSDNEDLILPRIKPLAELQHLVKLSERIVRADVALDQPFLNIEINVKRMYDTLNPSVRYVFECFSWNFFIAEINSVEQPNSNDHQVVPITIAVADLGDGMHFYGETYREIYERVQSLANEQLGDSIEIDVYTNHIEYGNFFATLLLFAIHYKTDQLQPYEAEIVKETQQASLNAYLAQIIYKTKQTYPEANAGEILQLARQMFQQDNENIPTNQDHLSTAELRDKSGYVYILNEINGVHYKIGRTKNPSDRLRTFEIKLPFEIEYDLLIQTNDMYDLEKTLHTRFADKRVDGEWFKLTTVDLQQIQDEYCDNNPCTHTTKQS